MTRQNHAADGAILPARDASDIRPSTGPSDERAGGWANAHLRFAPGGPRAIISGYVVTGGSAGSVLKVSSASLTKVPNFRSLRLLVLKGYMALRANAVGLRIAGLAAELDVTDRPVFAKMAGDGEIIHSADGSIVHF